MSHGRSWASRLRRRRAARRAAAAWSTLVLAFVEPAWAQHGEDFRSPFNPAQCQRAVAFGQHLIQRDPSSARARLILAEGHLCRGLDDNPWALDEAISRLHEISVSDPTNFNVQLELAEALRKRFPLSEDTEQALLRARDLLRSADVGAARPALAQYLAQTTTAVADRRARTVSNVAVAQAEFNLSSVAASDLSLLVSLLAQTGPLGLQRAEEILAAYLARYPDDARAQFDRAEVQRGRVSPAVLRAHYAATAVRLCDASAGASTTAECSVARLRLTQIEKVLNDEAGLDERSAERREEPW